MSSIFFSLFIVAVVVAMLVAASLFWRNQDEFSREIDEEKPEDTRVNPLLRGINFLLSDQPDQALQEMVQVAKIRSESADVYMALGEMFRAQGEYGRAVRIHQNLLARPDVPLELHFQAYVSLGRDFQAGGLLDRALRHYAKALAIQPDHLESIRSCLRIREQSQEWTEAEWLVSRLEQIENIPQHKHRAYLYAEMAKQAFDEANFLACEEHALTALKLSSSCGHAHLLLMTCWMQEKKFSQVTEQVAIFLEDVQLEHHVLLPEIMLLDADFYAHFAQPLLHEAWLKHYDVEFGVCWIESLLKTQGLGAAKPLKEKLNMQDVSLRHELRLLVLSEHDDNLVLQAKTWKQSMKHYGCKKCGVQVHDMRWQCPKCNTWGSMVPLQASQIFGDEEHV
ncbi:MAG: heat-shock protein [Ghiorsea sp.]